MNAVMQSEQFQRGAMPPTGTHVPGQYLSFLLGAEMYAIGILGVKEIIEYGGLTEVPMMPPTIRGIINLRGAVVPVLDLAARLGKPPAPPGKRSCIVIVEVDQENVVGMVVDAVNAVLDIASADLAAPPVFGSRSRSDCVECIASVGGKFVIVLDVARALAPGELNELNQLADLAGSTND